MNNQRAILLRAVEDSQRNVVAAQRARFVAERNL
jgi:hypothetical protein